MQNQKQIEFYEFIQKNEKRILGSILADNSLMKLALDQKMFYSFLDTKHRLIFSAMTDLYNRKEEITAGELITELDESVFLEEVGGGSYVTSILNEMPSVLSERNQESVQRFMIISITMSLQNIAFSDNSLKDLNTVFENRVEQMKRILSS